MHVQLHSCIHMLVGGFIQRRTALDPIYTSGDIEIKALLLCFAPYLELPTPNCFR